MACVGSTVPTRNRRLSRGLMGAYAPSMTCGNVLLGLTGVIALGLANTAQIHAGEERDWRLEILKEEGVPSETAALQALQDGFELTPARLEKSLANLGADDFKTREQAQREIILLGKNAQPWLLRLPKSEDPEVRTRLAEITRALQVEGRWARKNLVREAVISLLRERRKEAPPKPEEALFVELFRHPAASLDGGYGKFSFHSEHGLTGRVSDGLLRLKGKHDSEGDQQLLLDAKALTGQQEFPDAFRIEVKLGGETGGQGTYHVGVSVGNVRALFHPGYQTGGFRFERIDTHEKLSDNTSMGFDPKAGKLQRMSIEVKRLADGKLALDVLVTDGEKSFSERKTFAQSVTGKLDRIGLDRSGRTGGDALFDDLVVDLRNR